MFDLINLIVTIFILSAVFLVIKVFLVSVDQSTFTWKIVWMQFLIWGLNIAVIVLTFIYVLKI
jgi:hypothetical protein